MKILCLLLPHFPLICETLRNPALGGRPVVVTYPSGSQKLVLDYSPELDGLRRDLPLQQALSRYGKAVLLQSDVPYYWSAFNEILDRLEGIIPLVEGNSLRLGFLQVLGLGKAAADAIEKAQRKDPFRSISDFLERTGVLEEIAIKLAGAGAFDGLEPNRRKTKWEIGLRYRPVNSQMALPLTIEQDFVELASPDAWEHMQEEYNVLSLFPAGHVMAHLRPRFNGSFSTSRDIERLGNGTEVKAAGLVIRRQRPHGKVVFITLEDEFGHIPCMVFGKVYERYEHTFRSPFLIVKGLLSRREGACNVVIRQAQSFNALEKVPQSKDWR